MLYIIFKFESPASLLLAEAIHALKHAKIHKIFTGFVVFYAKKIFLNKKLQIRRKDLPKYFYSHGKHNKTASTIENLSSLAVWE